MACLQWFITLSQPYNLAANRLLLQEYAYTDNIISYDVSSHCGQYCVVLRPEAIYIHDAML